MPIRPANTVNIIRRRLDEAERADSVDPMELIGLDDELSRLERKWRQQLAEGSERRRPDDIQKLNEWFDRLALLTERLLRTRPDLPTTRALTELVSKIQARSRS